MMINSRRKFMSRIGRQLMLLTWALLACTLSGWGGVARRVLVIHSYEESYAAYPDFNRKIADAFAKRNMAHDHLVRCRKSI